MLEAEWTRRCLSSYALSDFSSKDHMERNGWLFGWTGSGSFKPQRDFYAPGVSSSSYWGFSATVDAELTLVLRGRGFCTLDFGNSWADAAGEVVVYLNGVEQSSAAAGKMSSFVKIPFRDGDVLRVVEHGAVIVINSVFFDCTDPDTSTTAGFTTAASTTTRSSTSSSTTGSSTTTTTSLTSTTATGTAEAEAQRRREREEELEALKSKAEQQSRSESEAAEALKRAAERLQQLEALEKEELLKARLERQRKDELEKKLQRMKMKME